MPVGDAAERGDDSSSLASAVLAMLAWLDALAMTPAFWYSPTLRSKKFLWCKSVNGECVRVLVVERV